MPYGPRGSTNIPTTSPQNPIIPVRCPHDQLDPTNKASCVDVCPPLDEHQPSGCVKKCASADNSSTDCSVICDPETDFYPVGCLEACCERNFCWDGSHAPQDPENCATLCTSDGSSTVDECSIPCSTDGGPNPIFCVDICTGRSDDPSTCREPCCPKILTAIPMEITAFPSTRKPQQPIAKISPTRSPVIEPTVAPTDPKNAPNSFLTENPVEDIVPVMLPTELPQVVTSFPTVRPTASVINLPTLPPVLPPQVPTCPNGNRGPINPAMCLIICPPGGPYLPGLCTAACDEDGEPPAEVPFCVDLCVFGSTSVPEGCVEACCSVDATGAPSVEILTSDSPTPLPAALAPFDATDMPVIEFPTRLQNGFTQTLSPTGAPQQLIIPTTCPDGSRGPINMSLCLLICPPGGPYLPGICTAACDEDGEPPFEVPFCVQLCESGSTSVPEGCVEACCSPGSVTPTGAPSIDPTMLPTETPKGVPTLAPQLTYSAGPTEMTSTVPTGVPTAQPSAWPSVQPVGRPTSKPTEESSMMPTFVETTTFPTSAPITSIVPTCPDGSRGPKNEETCRVVCPADGQVKPFGCLEPCGQRNAPKDCVRVCPAGMETLSELCVEPCCLPEFVGVCEIDGSPAPKYPGKCVAVCPSSTDPSATDPPGCLNPCTSPNVDPELLGCANICPVDGSILPPNCQEPCCPELPTNFPTSAPQDAIASTCPDGSIGPIDPSMCEIICPVIGPHLADRCTPACKSNGQPPPGATTCTKVCQAGFRNVPEGCTEACCPFIMDSPAPAPSCPTDDGPRPVFDPLPPECESPTPAPQSNIVGTSIDTPTIPMHAFDMPQNGIFRAPTIRSTVPMPTHTAHDKENRRRKVGTFF